MAVSHQTAKVITSFARKMGWSPEMEADYWGNKYLGDANEATERGDTEKGERLYAKGQYWLDRYNKISGNA